MRERAIHLDSSGAGKVIIALRSMENRREYSNIKEEMKNGK